MAKATNTAATTVTFFISVAVLVFREQDTPPTHVNENRSMQDEKFASEIREILDDVFGKDL